MQAVAGFAHSDGLMNDPTEIVLTGGFVAALGIFMFFAWLRAVSNAGKPVNLPATEDESPYQSPTRLEFPSKLPPELPVGKVPTWFYQPFDLIGAAFVFLFFSFMVIASFGAPDDTTVALTPPILLVNIGFQFMMAGVVTILVIRRVGPVEWLGLRWPAWRWVFLIAPGAVFLMWSIFGGLQYSGYMEWMESLGVETVQDTVKLLQDSKDPLILGLMAFAAVIAAPLCEEIVFRGYFYPVLKKFSGVWPAALCSALVFAGAHGSLTAFLPLFLFGCLLVLIYEKTGSLWASIAVHLCFNGATVLVQVASRYLDIPLEAAP